MRLALALTSAQADRLGIAPAVLARATLEDLCDLPDAGFRAAAGCFRHQLLLPRRYLVLTKPLRLDIQCQRGASVKIGWKYLDD